MEHKISGSLPGEKEMAVVSATAEEIRRKIVIDRRTNTTLWDLVSYQQETFQRLMGTTLNTYMNILRIPFSFYQVEVNATKAATQQATQQATKVATEQVKHLAEQATQQATEAATEQVKQLAEQAVQQATKAATQEVKHLAKQAAQQATEAAIEQVKQLAGNATQQAIEADGTAAQGERKQA